MKRNWGQLEGYRGGLDQLLWKWNCPEQRNILSFEPLRRNPRSVVVATMDSLFVLEALTGSVRMRTKHDDLVKQNLMIDGPMVSSGSLMETPLNGDKWEMPFVVDHPSIRGSSLATTVSRRMVPAQADGKYRPILPSLQIKQKESHPSATIDADPRLIRPLPWVQGAMNDLRQFENRAWNMFLTCFGLPLLVIVIPLRIIRRAIQDEQSLSSRVVRAFAAIALSTVALGIAGPIFYGQSLRSYARILCLSCFLMAIRRSSRHRSSTTVIRFAAQLQWRLAASDYCLAPSQFRWESERLLFSMISRDPLPNRIRNSTIHGSDGGSFSF